MPQVARTISIAANTTVEVLENLGVRLQTLPGGPNQVYAIALLATTTAAGLEHSFFVGNSQPIERSAVSSANRYPVQHEDNVNGEPIFARGGNRLAYEVTNTTAGALVLTFILSAEKVR